MNLRVIVISAACLSICVAPACSTSLLAAAAAVKGAIIGAGLTALKSGGGSETVIIQSQPGVAESPSNQITVQEIHKPVYVQTAQTLTYTSSNPLSRLWGAVSSVIAAKTKAISDILSPKRVIVIVPPTTTPRPTEKPTPVITVELDKPSVDVELGNKPVHLPSIDIELGNKPVHLPSIDVELGNKPVHLPSIGIELSNKPLVLPSIDVEVNHKPLQLPTIDVELNHKPLSLPSVGLSASIGRDYMIRRFPMAVVNYVKK